MITMFVSYSALMIADSATTADCQRIHSNSVQNNLETSRITEKGQSFHGGEYNVTTVNCEQYSQYNIVRYDTTQTSLDSDLMDCPSQSTPSHGGIRTPIFYTVFVSASLHPSLHLNPSFDFDLMGVVHPKVPHSVGGIRTPIYYMVFCVHKSTPQSASQSVQPILHLCGQQTDTDTKTDQ